MMTVYASAKSVNCKGSNLLAHTVNLIVSCTNRKRFNGSRETAVRDTGGVSLADRLQLWKRNLRTAAVEEHCADELYMGDHWSVVRSIPAEAVKSGLHVQTWICSAGYGLIRGDTQIKAYRATFTRGEDDYIAAGLADNECAPELWWRGVCTYRFPRQSSEPRTIAALATSFPHTPIVLALSADYLKAVTGDLEDALQRSYFQDHLAIISCGTSSARPTWKDNLLPCDASLSRGLGGALTSLNARVARRLFQSFNQSEITVGYLKESVMAIERGPRGALCSRVTKSDSEVANFIRSRLKTMPPVSKTVLLREFRSAGQACEQKRFGQIYASVALETGVNA